MVHGFSLQWLLLLQSKGSGVHGLSGCGTWAQLPKGMWLFPRAGIEPVSPELAGSYPLGHQGKALVSLYTGSEWATGNLSK